MPDPLSPIPLEYAASWKNLRVYFKYLLAETLLFCGGCLAAWAWALWQSKARTSSEPPWYLPWLGAGLPALVPVQLLAVLGRKRWAARAMTLVHGGIALLLFCPLLLAIFILVPYCILLVFSQRAWLAGAQWSAFLGLWILTTAFEFHLTYLHILWGDSLLPEHDPNS